MKVSNFAMGLAAGLLLMAAACAAQSAPNPATAPPPTAPFTDFRYEKPGVTHKILPSDMPKPMATKSATNGPKLIDRPKNAWPIAPAGFKVELFATGFNEPRKILTAPNGDIFMVESSGGDLKVFRGITADGKPVTTETFVTGLKQPYGIAFYPPGPDPQCIYVGDTNEVHRRFPYHNGDLQASGASQHIADLPAGGGHWTRAVDFSLDGKKMFVAVGSASNDDDTDTHPARKIVPTFGGATRRIASCRCTRTAFAMPVAGLGESADRRAVVLSERARRAGRQPRARLHHACEEGGFYGWPWCYIGGNQDPRQKGKHPELKDKVIVPDVLLQPHNATLELTFYEGKQFPAEYQGDIFCFANTARGTKPCASATK